MLDTREYCVSYFKELDEELKCYLEQAQIEKCYQAYLVAEKAHHGQMRRSASLILLILCSCFNSCTNALRLSNHYGHIAP